VFRANGDGSLCRRKNALLCRRATGGGCRCRPGYLAGGQSAPRELGAILIFGGASFIAKNFLVVFAPQSDLPYVIVPMFLAMVSLTLWLLIKGVDRARWDARWNGC
jgi:hypothetical protein